MADYMFPANPPPMPPEFMDAMSGDGGAAFAGAMEGGMEAFAAAMGDGGDMAGAGDAFMDFMHDACANGDIPGVSPEMFDAVADGFADVAGPALLGMPGDAGPGDMAEVFGEAVDMMMPEGMDMPPEMGDMFGNMADTMADCGCGPHDMGAEFGPEMPEDFIPGDPGTYPEGDFVAPGEAGDPGGPDPFVDTGGPEIFDPAMAETDAASALDGALGGPTEASDPDQGGTIADAAIGAAMDGAMAQSGPTEANDPDQGGLIGEGDHFIPEGGDTSPEDDGSSGMA